MPQDVPGSHADSHGDDAGKRYISKRYIGVQGLVKLVFPFRDKAGVARHIRKGLYRHEDAPEVGADGQRRGRTAWPQLES